MTLQPQEYFAICRQISDPADLTVYYIQAEIRDAVTDVLIATINLDSKGAGRWRKSWQVVADPSNLGRYITITTRVYDDAGYTTLDQNYGAEEREYLVQRRIVRPGGNGGGGGIDKKDLRKILQEELAAIEKDEPAEVDLNPVLKRLEDVHSTLLAGQESPEPEEVKPIDLSPILDNIASLKANLEQYRAEDAAEDSKEDEKDSIIEDLHSALSDFQDIVAKQEAQAESQDATVKETIDALKGIQDQIQSDYEKWQTSIIAEVSKIIEITLGHNPDSNRISQMITSFMENKPLTPKAPDYSKRISALSS